ncbi:MAG: UDP-glucose/GDP-mannose dehydrogenase family protein, partial [Elusimicrobiota bacterium]
MKKKSGVITKKVCVIGTGYVGLVTGTCLAEIGHKVICVDNNAGKIKLLKAGRMPIYESGLRELVLKNVKSKRLGFSYSISDSVKKSDIIFIAVGTPTRDDGSSDLTQVERVASEIARNVNGYKIVVEKSTVPVETGGWVKKTVQRNNRSKWQVDVVSNPEFLREGSAVHDFLNPDRIVLGVETAKAEKELQELYAPLKAKMLVTDIKSAEIIKHASNSFLATKISFINAVANVCERAGADIEKVSEGMGLDKRIGPAFLKAGCGFGGFCFPKDLRAFGWISNKLGYDFALLKEVDKVNQLQKE